MIHYHVGTRENLSLFVHKINCLIHSILTILPLLVTQKLTEIPVLVQILSLLLRKRGDTEVLILRSFMQVGDFGSEHSVLPYVAP